MRSLPSSPSATALADLKLGEAAEWGTTPPAADGWAADEWGMNPPTTAGRHPFPLVPADWSGAVWRETWGVVASLLPIC